MSHCIPSFVQRGTLRFGGTTEFQTGQWAGIELDTEIGKNDGSYGGIRYFSCKPKFGLFVPMHRVSRDAKDTRQDRKKKLVKKRDPLLTSSLAVEVQSHVQKNSEMQVGVCLV